MDQDPVAKPTQIMGKSTFFLQKYFIFKYFIYIKPNLAVNKKHVYNAEDI